MRRDEKTLDDADDVKTARFGRASSVFPLAVELNATEACGHVP
jgi:hypothetical protein